MKWIIVLLLVPVVAGACPKGSSPYKDTCVYDLEPNIAPPVQPSDEKVPDDKMPSYQREGISIVDAPNMAYEDAKADQAKLDADKQGKKSAGIKYEH